MNPSLRFLFLLLTTVPLAAFGCGREPTRTTDAQTSTVVGAGPSVVDATELPPPPEVEPPTADQTLYVVWLQDSKTGKPVANASVSLLKEVPEPLYMRVPPRRIVIQDSKTRIHGRAVFMVQADGKPKYVLVHGRGFMPFVREAPASAGGQTYEMEIPVEIVPTFELVVRSPNGDRADQALCTMKPADMEAYEAEGKLANRPGQKANYGWTERADDLGVATFNRRPGKYRLECSDRQGRHRYYELVDWNGQQEKPYEVTLPEQSMQKPW